MFACDMERVLAEQPPDTWDSFPLFQVLNDYLRTDGKEINLNVFGFLVSHLSLRILIKKKFQNEKFLKIYKFSKKKFKIY
jgi:hypothetical protein